MYDYVINGERSASITGCKIMIVWLNNVGILILVKLKLNNNRTKLQRYIFPSRKSPDNNLNDTLLYFPPFIPSELLVLNGCKLSTHECPKPSIWSLCLLLVDVKV